MKISTEHIKSLRIKYNNDIQKRVDLDRILLNRIGKTALIEFWDSIKQYEILMNEG